MSRIMAAVLSAVLLAGPLSPAAQALGGSARQQPAAHTARPTVTARFVQRMPSLSRMSATLTGSRSLIGLGRAAAPGSLVLPAAPAAPDSQPAQVREQLAQTVETVRQGRPESAASQLYDRRKVEGSAEAPGVAGAEVAVPNFLNKEAAAGRRSTRDRVPVLSRKATSPVNSGVSSAVFSRALAWARANPLKALAAAVPVGAVAAAFIAPSAYTIGAAVMVPALAMTVFESGRPWRMLLRAEKRKVDAARAAFVAKSRIAAFFDADFTRKSGGELLDPTPTADYHGEAYVDAIGRPQILLTHDTVNESSWAFMHAIKLREQTFSNDKYADLPASAEKMAVAYASMALGFAEATDSSINSWAPETIDHRHKGGNLYVWSYYHALHQAAMAPVNQLVNSRFFTTIRDQVAKVTADNPAFQFSIYELHTGKYFRPDSSLNGQDIPSHIRRLTRHEYEAALLRFYGENYDGGKVTESNFWDGVLKWFRMRGNI